MMYFNGYDINGKPCRVEEYGNDAGYVRAYASVCQVIRIAPSTYVETNGIVYASSQVKCAGYTTPENLNFAKKDDSTWVYD